MTSDHRFEGKTRPSGMRRRLSHESLLGVTADRPSWPSPPATQAPPSRAIAAVWRAEGWRVIQAWKHVDLTSVLNRRPVASFICVYSEPYLPHLLLYMYAVSQAPRSCC